MSTDGPARRIGWLGSIVAVLLGAWAFCVWTELRPQEIASDWHGWRQTDTEAIALNLTQHDASILRPQISWGADGPGYVETEFQLYPKLVSLLMRIVGRVEWIGQFISLLAVVATAGVGFVHLSQRYHPLAAALGFCAFLAARNSPSLASLIMPDALALFFYVTAWAYFWQYAKHGRTRARTFCISGTRGWTLGREQADVTLLAEATHKGARFFADPTNDRLTLLDSWLSAHAQLIWSGESGERIWRLQ